LENVELASEAHEETGVETSPDGQDRPVDRGPARWALIAVLVVGSMGVGIGIDRLFLATASDSEVEEADGFTILDETYLVIRDNYVLEDEISDQDLMYGAAMGMVQSLGDTNHSRFYDPEDARRFVETSLGELTGIGVNIDATSLPLRVTMPIEGSPAYEAGIQAGDLIVGIDGVMLSDLSGPAEALTLIRGEEGTQLTLLIQRPGVVEPFEVTLTRTTIEIHPVSWAMLPGNVLWVRIDQFSRGAGEDFEAALQAGITLGATGLLLDLRANPGGLVTEAIAVGDQLLPKDSVLFQKEGADGEIEEVRTSSDEGLWQNASVVVVIDSDSASAAEIIASSLEDNGRAILVGETTAGTGTVLSPVELSDGSLVLVGTELWLTPHGEVIWHNGVDPTIEVENGEGVTVSLPFTFERHVVEEEALSGLEDDQLTTAHRRLLDDLFVFPNATPAP
jgi:carboxyl-terminal processing protease